MTPQIVLDEPPNPGQAIRARAAFGRLFGPDQDVEHAKTVAEEALGTIDRYLDRPDFYAETVRRYKLHPDSPALNLAMALLMQETYPDRNLSLDRRRGPNVKFPVWLRLTLRAGDVREAFSVDGEHWTDLDGVTLPLGDQPLAVLPVTDPPLASNLPLVPNVAAVVDHVALDAAPAPSAASDRPLPAPWVETTLPPRSYDDPAIERKSSASVAPSEVRSDGAFVLRAAGGDLSPLGDTGRLVQRPWGDARIFAARVVSFDANPGACTGLMLRANTDAEAPFAAILVDGAGNVSSLHRRVQPETLKYWRKLAALRPDDQTAQLALAEALSRNGYGDEAIAVCDRLLAADPIWLFGSQGYELRRIFGDEAAPRLSERLVKWQPTLPLPEDEKRRLAYAFASSASDCAKQKRPDLVASLCQRSLELYDERGLMRMGQRGPDVHALLFDALVALNRRDEAADELLTRLVPLHPSIGQRRQENKFYYTVWSAYSFGSDGYSVSAMSEIATARQAGLLLELEAAVRRRLAQSDGHDFHEGGADWLLALIRLCRHDPTVLVELHALFSEKTSALLNLQELAPVIPNLLHFLAARQLQQWPGREHLALDALQTVPGLLDVLQKIRGQGESTIGLHVALVEIQLGDSAAALATLVAVESGLAQGGSPLVPSMAQGGAGDNADYSRRCLALLQRLSSPEADAAFLQTLERVRRGPAAAEFGDLYEAEKQRRLVHAPATSIPPASPHATNLIANPDFDGLASRDPDAATFSLPGWKDLPMGFWLPGSLNGPIPGQPFVQCEIFSEGGGSTLRNGHYVPTDEHLIRGERIRLEKGGTYLQGAWLRNAGDGGYVHFGRNYLDENGAILKSTECPESPSLGWHEVTQRLLSSDKATSPDETMPTGTAFVEPYLKWNRAVDWTGLYVARVN